MKDFRDLEKEYYVNRKRIRKLFYTFKIFTYDGRKKYIELKNRNEWIKNLFDNYGVKLR